MQMHNKRVRLYGLLMMDRVSCEMRLYNSMCFTTTYELVSLGAGKALDVGTFRPFYRDETNGVTTEVPGSYAE